jgi:hypothetical protein
MKTHFVGSIIEAAASLLISPTVASANLTGVWNPDGGGTYYVLQTGTEVWWAGVSADGGRQFTNVFHGYVRPDDEVMVVEGTWADLPRCNSAWLGTLRLASRYRDSFCKQSDDGHFGASLWRRLNPNCLPTAAGIVLKALPGKGDLTGVWSGVSYGGTFYLRQVDDTVWRLLLRPLGVTGEFSATVFEGQVRGRWIEGVEASIPWGHVNAGHTFSTVVRIGKGGLPTNTLTSNGEVLRRITAIGVPPSWSRRAQVEAE